jgi:DNA polymerase-3 subunit delta'
MSFKQVYGHEKMIALLKGAVLNKRLSHAYLFNGIDGVGKKTTALNLAKAVNCLESGPDACDNCISCRKIDRGRHPDILMIEPDGQFIRIKEVRDIQNQMRFSPLEGRSRVFIINEADRMNEPAANALLKTLEEPTRHNILILISSRLHRLPATILSRCQRLRFDPLPEQIVASYLEEQCGVERTQAALLAASASGSIGKAVEMNEGAYVELKKAVIDRFVAIQYPLDFFSFLSDFEPDREDVIKRLDILGTWYRDMLMFRECGEIKKIIHRDRTEELRRMAAALSGPEILEGIKTIGRTRKALDQNANRQLALECMMLRLFRNRLEKRK